MSAVQVCSCSIFLSQILGLFYRKGLFVLKFHLFRFFSRLFFLISRFSFFFEHWNAESVKRSRYFALG